MKLLIRIAGAAVCDATKFNRSGAVGAKNNLLLFTLRVSKSRDVKSTAAINDLQNFY